jgi:hypothetical protein
VIHSPPVGSAISLQVLLSNGTCLQWKNPVSLLLLDRQVSLYEDAVLSLLLYILQRAYRDIGNILF